MEMISSKEALKVCKYGLANRSFFSDDIRMKYEYFSFALVSLILDLSALKKCMQSNRSIYQNVKTFHTKKNIPLKIQSLYYSGVYCFYYLCYRHDSSLALVVSYVWIIFLLFLLYQC